MTLKLYLWPLSTYVRMATYTHMSTHSSAYGHISKKMRKDLKRYITKENGKVTCKKMFNGYDIRMTQLKSMNLHWLKRLNPKAYNINTHITCNNRNVQSLPVEMWSGMTTFKDSFSVSYKTNKHTLTIESTKSGIYWKGQKTYIHTKIYSGYLQQLFYSCKKVVNNYSAPQ